MGYLMTSVSFARFAHETRSKDNNKKGYREGRPKRVLNDRYRHALELMETNSMREVEKKTNISLSTLKRIKKQYKEELIKNY